MIKQLSTLRSELHDKIKAIRCVERVVASDIFQEAWKLADDTGKLAAQITIDWYDKVELNKWVARHRSKQLGEYSIRELYEVARKYHIENYTRLNKTELLSIIASKEEGNDEGRHVETDGKPANCNVANDQEIQSSNREVTTTEGSGV